MGRVIVLGSLNVDVVVSVDRHPKVGETIRATSITTMPGGKGANQAVAAAAAGAQTHMIGAVGTDPHGDRYLNHLAASGVQTSAVRRAQEPTGSATITVDSAGRNSIIIDPGANGSVGQPELDALGELLAPGDVLTTMLEIPEGIVAAAFELAASRGATSVLNPSPWSPGAADLAGAADLVVVNTLEANELGRSDDAVVMTFGEQGALWAGVHASAPRVETVDTTGAGDTFTGTLCARLALGEQRDAALQAAVLAGAAAVTRIGAQRWAV